MKLLEQEVHLITQEPGWDGLIKQIERAGKTCYKSENTITEGSAEKFLERMKSSDHLSVLEHGTVYLVGPSQKMRGFYDKNPYSRTVTKREVDYVTTNMRVLVENGWEDDLEHLVEKPWEEHHRRYALKCVTSIRAYSEITRHRTFSFSIESTRYCNYSKGKFGGELNYIRPPWLGDDEASKRYLESLKRAEEDYFALLDLGWTPEKASEILGKSLKSEMFITGFTEAWDHLFDLRLFEKTGKVHPVVLDLSKLMYNELKNNEMPLLWK